MHGNDYTIIKAANRQLIINTVAEFGAMSVMEILHNTRLSRPTIEALVRELQQDGILEEAGGKITDFYGNPLTYTGKSSILAASPGVVAGGDYLPPEELIRL